MAKLTGFSLSFKVLVMTVLVVMLMQVLVYVPSVVSFERYEIENRVRAASVAAHAVTTYPDSSVPQNIQVDLLHQLDAYALVLQQNGTKMLVAVSDSPPMVTHDIALPHGSFVDLAKLAFDTIFDGSGHTVRAIAPYGDGGEIELVFSGESLRRMLLAFSARVLFFSLIMSTITAILVFVTIRSKLIIPFKRLGLLLDSWSQDPEGSSYLIQHTGRRDEIGLAELGLARIQQRLQELFKQQRRLAELGLAVSKINHDLRNILASAQLISDRMSTIPDPSVQRFAPKLVSTIDRAVNYCQSVLAYGKAQEPPPSRRLVALSRLAEDVASVTGLQSHGVIDWVNAVPETLEVDADSEQLFRVLLNLVRNSMQAMEQNGDDSVVRRLTVSAERKVSLVRIVVADTGPGLPPKAREALFKPFQGSVRRGGTGLGLAIAAELVRAHGGTIAALENGPGATFVIEIPDRDAAPA